MLFNYLHIYMKCTCGRPFSFIDAVMDIDGQVTPTEVNKCQPSTLLASSPPPLPACRFIWQVMQSLDIKKLSDLHQKCLYAINAHVATPTMSSHISLFLLFSAIIDKWVHFAAFQEHKGL